MSFLLASALLIAVNALFVLMEFALVKVRSSRIEVLARKGSVRALKVQKILGSLDQYLAAIQVGLTVISLALGWIGEPALAAAIRALLARAGIFMRPEFLHILSFALALVLLSCGHIIFGELIPRSIGIQKADVVSLWGAYPLQLLAKVISVPVSFMSFCSVSFLKLFGFKAVAHSESIVSEEELRILLGENQERGALPLERLLLLENLFDLGAAKVAEAMTPREKIVFLSLSRPWEENLALIRSRRYSRYPLCEDGLDSVIGMMHVKDLLLKPELSGPAPEFKHARRDITEVSEGDSLEKLLKTFPDKGIHMALVRDKLGRVSGLLTLEDIIEELVGEVHDEFDLPQAWSFMSVVVPGAVVVGQVSDGRKEAIAHLMEKLAAAEPALKAQEALQTVWDREMKFSSAVGRGVAVPHGRLLNLERPLVALGRFAKPVSFPTPDNIPVRLVFLILTPASTPVIQLKVLGRIAALVTNETLRRKLLRAKTSEAMLELLRTADTMLA